MRGPKLVAAVSMFSPWIQVFKMAVYFKKLCLGSWLNLFKWGFLILKKSLAMGQHNMTFKNNKLYVWLLWVSKLLWYSHKQIAVTWFTGLSGKESVRNFVYYSEIVWNQAFPKLKSPSKAWFTQYFLLGPTKITQKCASFQVLKDSSLGWILQN